MMTLDDYRFVFIVTYARSGSTLLQSLINTAPGVQLRGENMGALLHIFRACNALHETALRGRKDQTAEVDNPWFGAGEIEVQGACRQMLNLFLRRVLKPQPGVAVTGFKEIRHLPFHIPRDEEFAAYADFLLERFPRARIVCNSRDATAVSRSAWLRNEDPQRIGKAVRAADDRFRALAARSERCLHMQYEDYVASPAPLQEMFDFLELPFDAARVQAVLDKPLTHAIPAASTD